MERIWTSFVWLFFISCLKEPIIQCLCLCIGDRGFKCSFCVWSKSKAVLDSCLIQVFFSPSVNWDWVIKPACFVSLGNIISEYKNKLVNMNVHTVHTLLSEIYEICIVCLFFNVHILTSLFQHSKYIFYMTCYRLMNF